MNHSLPLEQKELKELKQVHKNQNSPTRGLASGATLALLTMEMHNVA